MAVTVQALKLQNDDEYALIARSRCQLKQGNLQAALEDVNVVLKEDSSNYRVRGSFSDI